MHLQFLQNSVGATLYRLPYGFWIIVLKQCVGLDVKIKIDVKNNDTLNTQRHYSLLPNRPLQTTQTKTPKLNTDILHVHTKGRKLDTLEQLEIYKHTKTHFT